MTSNSIQYMANLEQQRHNQAMEFETNRSNLRSEYQRGLEIEIGQRNASVNERNATSKEKEVKAETKLKKAQTKKVKKETKKVSAEIKKVKADTKLSKANTKKAKRETAHIGVAEAQAAKDLQLKESKLNLDADWNAWRKIYDQGDLDIKKAKNQIDKDKVYHSMLKNAFDNPALLAYYGLLDQSSAAKKAKKGVLSTFKSALNAISSDGVQGALDSVATAHARGLVSATDSKSIQALIRTSCLGANTKDIANFVKKYGVTIAKQTAKNLSK